MVKRDECPRLIRWGARRQGQRGGGGKAAVYSEDNTSQYGFLHAACLQRSNALAVFFLLYDWVCLRSQRLLVFLSLIGEKIQDAGYYWNQERSLIWSLLFFPECFEMNSKALLYQTENPTRYPRNWPGDANGKGFGLNGVIFVWELRQWKSDYTKGN